MQDDALPGGMISAAVRVGDTVVRNRGANSAFVHALLDHLAAVGWSGVPRLLGSDSQRETLTFLEGTVPWRRPLPGWAISDEALAGVARLVRQLHDLTAGTSLAAGGEVVCHNDLAPKNTVYRFGEGGWMPVAFLDWDLAGSGQRIDDVAHVCWQWLDLGPAVIDVGEARQRITLIADAYGLTDPDRLILAVLGWQDRCWRGIETGASAGDPAMRRLLADGVPAAIRVAHAWTLHHQDQLQPERHDPCP